MTELTSGTSHTTPLAGVHEAPLAGVHEALGASFTDFGGWRMPVRYASDLAEHRAVRQAAGLFDISHMAQFIVEGPDRDAFLNYALALNIEVLKLSRAKYSMLLAPEGGIVDDLIVTRIAPDQHDLSLARDGQNHEGLDLRSESQTRSLVTRVS